MMLSSPLSFPIFSVILFLLSSISLALSSASAPNLRSNLSSMDDRLLFNFLSFSTLVYLSSSAGILEKAYSYSGSIEILPFLATALLSSAVTTDVLFSFFSYLFFMRVLLLKPIPSDLPKLDDGSDVLSWERRLFIYRPIDSKI